MQLSSALGWAAVGALLLLAAGGAADGGSVLLGVPRVGVALAAVALAGVALAAGGRAAGGVLLGLAPLVALLLLAAPLPGLRALTGPPLLSIAAAGLVLVVMRSARRPPEALFLPVVLALYGGVSLRVQAQVGPE